VFFVNHFKKCYKILATSSETQRPPSCLVLSKAFDRKSFGYWTAPPTPWIDSAKKAARLSPFGIEYFITSSN